jgi:hypothetical protein
VDAQAKASHKLIGQLQAANVPLPR